MTRQIGFGGGFAKRNDVTNLFARAKSGGNHPEFPPPIHRQNMRWAFRLLRLLTALLFAVFAFGPGEPALARERGAVENFRAKHGKLPTWQSHIRKGFDGGKWNKKCAAGKRMARNNPHKATLNPPACIRV